MSEFLSRLFSEDLMPHGYCLAWRPEILWLHVISDTLIALAYFSIPVTLFYFVRRRRDLPFSWVFYLFCAFILACGATHAIEIVTMWKAAYRLEGLAKAVTAAASLGTAIALIPLSPRALALRSPRELAEANRRLEAEVERRIVAERELQHTHAELEERVAERTAELAATTESLEREIAERHRQEEERRRLDAKILEAQKLESLALMAGGVAHDFNNLLTIISGRGEMLRRRLSENETALADVEPILQAAKVASALSEQMLLYTGQSGKRAEPVDVAETIRGLQQLLSATVGRHTEIVYRLDDDASATALIAPSEVRQLVMNLIINASEALDDKPGRVTVSVGLTRAADEPPASVEFSFLESDAERCVFIAVSDNAGGMDATTQKRIFDPFFTTKFTGRGLGLAVVMGIVKSRHGAVRLDSTPGRGSTFRILLPAVSDPRAEPSKPDEPHETAVRPGGGTVLVVDDNAGVRGLAEAVLQEDGYAVATAADGRGALELLAARGDAIDLVLLDVTMPRLSGPETLEKMREQGYAMPVILWSGYDEAQADPANLEPHGAVFLHKPFSPEELLELARRQLAVAAAG